MFVKLTYKDATLRPVILTGLKSAEDARALVWNANKDPAVLRADIIGGVTDRERELCKILDIDPRSDCSG